MVIVLLLAFFATDEPAQPNRLRLEKLSPAFSGAAISDEVLLRFTGDNERIWGSPRRMILGTNATMSSDPVDTVKFRHFLNTQRTEIEADWADLAVVRNWWDELAAFERLGDLSPGTPGDRTISFQPIRAYTQTAAAVAGREAVDGNGDAAFAILQPAIEVARKLEPASRSLIRSMISRVSQRLLIDAATYVLDTTEVPPEAKARFAEALGNGSGGPEGARHMIAVETARGAYLLEDPFRRMPGDLGAMAAIPILYNPGRTLNAYLEWSARMQDLAARRDIATMDTLTEAWLKGSAGLGVRNLGGKMLLQQMVPALSKVMDSYWKTEDKREALIKRLQEPGPAAKPAGRKE